MNDKMKKIKSIDLFAGCGGLMEGFEQSGKYETLAAVEWEKGPCRNPLLMNFFCIIVL